MFFYTTFRDSLKLGNKTLSVGNDASCENALHLDHIYVPIGKDLHYKLVCIHLKEKLTSVYDSNDHGILCDIFRQNFEYLINRWITLKSSNENLQIRIIHSPSCQQMS